MNRIRRISEFVETLAEEMIDGIQDQSQKICSMRDQYLTPANVEKFNGYVWSAMNVAQIGSTVPMYGDLPRAFFAGNHNLETKFNILLTVMLMALFDEFDKMQKFRKDTGGPLLEMKPDEPQPPPPPPVDRRKAHVPVTQMKQWYAVLDEFIYFASNPGIKRCPDEVEFNKVMVQMRNAMEDAK